MSQQKSPDFVQQTTVSLTSQEKSPVRATWRTICTPTLALKHSDYKRHAKVNAVCRSAWDRAQQASLTAQLKHLLMG